MKRNKIAGRGPKPPVVGTVLTILLVIAVLSTPMAASKYVATGLGSSKARIAGFRALYTQAAGYQGGAGYAVRSTAGSSSALINYPKYFFKSRSEVAVSGKVVPHYVAAPYGTPGATLHGLYKVGEYYGGTTNACFAIPPGGITGPNSTTQLGYEIWQAPDSAPGTGNRAATAGSGMSGAIAHVLSGGGTTANVTSTGAILGPNETNGVLVAAFIKPYSSAPGTPADANTSTQSTALKYDMTGYWRTYRVVTFVRATQVD